MIERLKELRKHYLKLTQKEFGERLGVSENVIKNLEYERVDIKDHMINLICKTFMVSEKWLRNGEEPIFIEDNAQIIDNLCVQYNFGKIERVLLEQFIQLDSEDRKSIVKYMANCVKNLSNVEVSVEQEEKKLTVQEMQEMQRIAREKPQAFLAAMNGGVIEVKPAINIEEIKKQIKE